MKMDENFLARKFINGCRSFGVVGENFGVDPGRFSNLWQWFELYHAPPVSGDAAPPPRPTDLRPTPVNLVDLTLVHMVRYGATSVLEQQPCREVMRNWDVLSCSLVNYRTGQPGAISSVGFALRAPPQNIVGAHPKDVWFPNHIGADCQAMPQGAARIAEAALLSEAICYNITKKGSYSDAADPAASLVKIGTPSQLSTIWGHRSVNEVLIVGRPAVNIHAVYRQVSEPATGAIRSATEELTIRFIIIYPCGRELEEVQGSHLTVQRYYQNYWEQACRLRNVNQGLAIKVAQRRAPGWDWATCAGRRAGDGFI